MPFGDVRCRILIDAEKHRFTNLWDKLVGAPGLRGGLKRHVGGGSFGETLGGPSRCPSGRPGCPLGDPLSLGVLGEFPGPNERHAALVFERSPHM